MSSTSNVAVANPTYRKSAADRGGGRGASPRRPDPAPEVVLPPDECRSRREALGLSIEDLARRASREPRTVERFEAATVTPRPVTIVALRNALRRAELEQAQKAQDLAQTCSGA